MQYTVSNLNHETKQKHLNKTFSPLELIKLYLLAIEFILELPLKVHFSSKTDLWSTPQYVFDYYNAVYNFTLDVCASPENAKCKSYFSKSDNGLKQPWIGTCWMNPPYGREINKWIAKAYKSSKENATVVCLLPARTDTKWFHDYCIQGKIDFIRGRLKFGQAQNSAPFPSMVVTFGDKKDIKKASFKHQNIQSSSIAL